MFFCVQNCKVYFGQFWIWHQCVGKVKPGRLGREPVLLTAGTGAPPPPLLIATTATYTVRSFGLLDFTVCDG